MQANTPDATPFKPREDIIRSIVRGTYDLQQLRIQMGNRITGNFKIKLGYKNEGMTEEQLDRQSKQVLNLLRLDYNRITDGIVEEGDELILNKLPREKSFKPGELIDSYAELVLVDAYMKILRDETENFNNLGRVLKGIPIYDEFLSEVSGLGQQLAGVIISEIDIHKTTYVSSLWKFAGLDVVRIGSYKDELGTEHTLSAWDINTYIAESNLDPNAPLYWKGKYLVTFQMVGRSRKASCLEQRDYVDREGKDAKRLSITFNPFLKTKMVGVLGSSFLRGSKTFVNGQKVGSADREKMAVKLGFKADKNSVLTVKHQINDYLRGQDYDVVVERTYYGAIYDDYKHRITNMPAHKEKSLLHIHNMATRYMVKRFLADLYNAWRRIENLPVMPEYAVAKLGLEHGVATFEKQAYYDNRKSA